MGIYVSPKFVYSFIQLNGIKGHFYDSEFEGTDESFSKSSDSFGNKDDSTFGGSIAVGYDFAPSFKVPVRAELEYAAFSQAQVKKNTSDYDEDEDIHSWIKNKQTFNIQTLFINAYYDINTDTAFTPYIGAGAGLAFIDTKFKNSERTSSVDEGDHSMSSSKTVTNFAWNVGAGCAYALDDNWALDLGYRFVGLGSVKTKSASAKYTIYGDTYTFRAHTKTQDLYMHQVALGLRYTF